MKASYKLGLCDRCNNADAEIFEKYTRVIVDCISVPPSHIFRTLWLLYPHNYTYQ